MTTRAALFLDFDNVFSGLMKLDPTAALRFAREPGPWLDRLSTRYLVDGRSRRWLVLRCYMNPAGSVANPDDPQNRIYFSKLRPFFTRAGFEVIDCPSLTFQTKNTADIRMVLDSMDALSSSTRYDEFVIASGDSDLAPLLVRMRAADRYTTILSPSDAVTAFTSIADRAIDAQQVLGLLADETIDDEEPVVRTITGPAPANADAERFQEFVTQAYRDADEPLNLARLSSNAVAALGEAATRSGWFGAGSFGTAVDRLELPHAFRSSHHLWDTSRHVAPATEAQRVDRPAQPAAVERLSVLLGVPRIARQAWPKCYDALSRFAATHDYNPVEATRWARDTLADEGTQVGRTALGLVLRASIFGGAPLDTDPPPTAEQIATATLRNVLDRAEQADIELDARELAEVRDWLGAPV